MKVRDVEGDDWFRGSDDLWYMIGDYPDVEGVDYAEVVEMYGPVFLLEGVDADREGNHPWA